jgi:membrane protease YdiL (CAAX protease family)
VGWAIFASVIPIPDTASAVIWRFWAELIPLLSIIALTLIFWLIDKRKIRLHLTGKPVYNIILGCVTGAIWLGVSIEILSLIKVVHIDSRNQISMLWLWMFSAFLNTIMQEMLVRGYLYQMIKSNYNIVAAVIVSTALFTSAHDGAFEAGILPVLNVITMSLFVTAVLEYTDSLIAPIIIHFLWNGVGAIVLGGVSLAEDYPHLFNMVISGNPILSGGICKIEGSIIVLLMNLILMIGFVIIKRKRHRNL